MPTTASKVVNTVSWITFFIGLVTITMAYLSVTFAGGSQTQTEPPILKHATIAGTVLMYVALLMMPIVPLAHHIDKKDINGYDWAAGVSQWFAYILLPIALYMWDQPKKAKGGAAILGVSLASLLASIFLTRKAHEKRQGNNPNSSTV